MIHEEIKLTYFQLIQQFQVAVRSTSSDMATVIQARPHGRFTRNLQALITAPFFEETVVAIKDIV